MIRIIETNPQLINMKIEMTIPQSDVFDYLKNKGYEIKTFLWEYEDETFPNGVTTHQSWTFTATKDGESQSEGTIYTSVFEKEMKGALKLQ